MVIETHNLTKKYKNEETLRYKDRLFVSGKAYAIMGASGCGKSTLLNMIAGIIEPTSGSVVVNGNNHTKIPAKDRDMFRIRNIGYVYQDFKLIEDMTVMDNIDILKLEGVDTSSAKELLHALGIWDQRNKKICHLSGGQKQRVAVARALVKNPPIVLADEPTGNLNFSTGCQVIQELKDLSKDKILIVVTHDTRLYEYFDEIIDLSREAEENV